MLKDFLFYKKKTEKEKFILSKNPEPYKAPYDILEKISTDIEVNKKYIENVFSVPENSDVVMRDVEICINGDTIKVLVLYCEGLARSDSVNECILKPFMYLNDKVKSPKEDTMSFIKKQLLPQGQTKENNDINASIEAANYGNAVIFVDGQTKAFIIDVKGWANRGISTPKGETVIQGPHEGFNEMIRMNTALLRKTLNTSNLVMEGITLGKTSKTPSVVAYLKNVADPEIVKEVKRRLESIDAEYILTSLDAEQFIEDEPYVSVPQILSTERPDRVSQSLIEGRVAIMVSGSPHVLIVPSTIFDFTRSTEDEYLRYPYSVFIKIIRTIAIILALFSPAIFIAVTTYHQDIILTNLLFSLEASRRLVPFPAILELFLLEISFELIKEAGVRVPDPIGQTLGIVGGLIIGQAAVSANIVSPIMIIVVAITGIASFAIPSYELSFSFRVSRFIYTISAAFAGFLGILTVLFIDAILVMSCRSIGAPYTAPLIPKENRSVISTFLNVPVWKKEYRPDYLKPRDNQKQAKISRKWMYKRK